MVEGKSTPYIRCTYYNERFQAQRGQEGELVGSFSRPRRSNECDQEHEYQGAHFNHLKLNSWMSHCWVKKSKYEHTKAFCASVDSPNKVTLNQWQRTHMARLSLELRNSASSFHWLSCSIFTYCSVVCPASVTPSLISTIWCFRPYKPYIFCDPGNMSVSFIAELSPVYCCLV